MRQGKAMYSIYANILYMTKTRVGVHNVIHVQHVMSNECIMTYIECIRNICYTYKGTVVVSGTFYPT